MPTSPKEFIKEMEGCITKGAIAENPLELKRMWEFKISNSSSVLKNKGAQLREALLLLQGNGQHVREL
jgi:hypothetical protein